MYYAIFGATMVGLLICFLVVSGAILSNRHNEQMANAEKARAIEVEAKYHKDAAAFPAAYQETLQFCGAEGEHGNVKGDLSQACANYAGAVDNCRKGDMTFAIACLGLANNYLTAARTAAASIRCRKEAEASLQPAV